MPGFCGNTGLYFCIFDFEHIMTVLYFDSIIFIPFSYISYFIKKECFDKCLGKISISPRLVRDELSFHRRFTLYAGHRPNSDRDNICV